MGKSEYYKVEQILHTFSPVRRFLSKYLPKHWFVNKCKCCNQIPTEVISSDVGYYCWDCYIWNETLKKENK
jgi:hypothetical protein